MDELVDASMKFTRVLKRKGVSQATLQVAVRARPLSRKEMSNGARTITKLVDERCVVVMDPDEDALENGVPGVPKPIRRKEVAAGVRKKERRYVFDAAYDGEASNEQVYRGTVLPHIAGVLRGTNATVFAYGATGSGKTHTMVGDTRDPGLMFSPCATCFASSRATPGRRITKSNAPTPKCTTSSCTTYWYQTRSRWNSVKIPSAGRWSAA